MPKVNTIYAAAFSYCTSLRSVYMPDIRWLGNSVFYGCSSLTTVSLPKIDYMGEEIFTACPLVSAYFGSNAPTSFDSTAFPGTCTAYYPQGRTGYDTWGYANTSTWVQTDNIYSLSVNGNVPDASGNITLTTTTGTSDISMGTFTNRP